MHASNCRNNYIITAFQVIRSISHAQNEGYGSSLFFGDIRLNVFTASSPYLIGDAVMRTYIVKKNKFNDKRATKKWT